MGSTRSEIPLYLIMTQPDKLRQLPTQGKAIKCKCNSRGAATYLDPRVGP